MEEESLVQNMMAAMGKVTFSASCGCLSSHILSTRRYPFSLELCCMCDAKHVRRLSVSQNSCLWVGPSLSICHIINSSKVLHFSAARLLTDSPVHPDPSPDLWILWNSFKSPKQEERQLGGCSVCSEAFKASNQQQQSMNDVDLVHS